MPQTARPRRAFRRRPRTGLRSPAAPPRRRPTGSSDARRQSCPSRRPFPPASPPERQSAANNAGPRRRRRARGSQANSTRRGLRPHRPRRLPAHKSAQRGFERRLAVAAGEVKNAGARRQPAPQRLGEPRRVRRRRGRQPPAAGLGSAGRPCADDVEGRSPNFGRAAHERPGAGGDNRIVALTSRFHGRGDDRDDRQRRDPEPQLPQSRAARRASSRARKSATLAAGPRIIMARIMGTAGRPGKAALADWWRSFTPSAFQAPPATGSSSDRALDTPDLAAAGVGRELDFRKDINGLRAVAVLGVVAFHADRALVPGGFAGVDVFFVISGFLISRIILSECAVGHFSLPAFYAKRAKRILPALLVVVTAVWIVGWFRSRRSIPRHWGRPARQPVFHREFLAHAAGRSRQIFGSDSAAKPLLHLWSLSIEEQFYLVWSVLLLAVFKLNDRLLPFVILGIFLASFRILRRSDPDQSDRRPICLRRGPGNSRSARSPGARSSFSANGPIHRAAARTSARGWASHS